MSDKPEMSCAEAGRRGGKTTAKKYGKKHYSEIGKKGGAATAEKYGREFYVTIGRRGGLHKVDVTE